VRPVYADHFRGTLECDQATYLRIAEASRNPHLQRLYQRLLAMQMWLLLLYAQSHGGQERGTRRPKPKERDGAQEVIDVLTMRDAHTAERLCRGAHAHHQKACRGLYFR
jgi:DNA-binding GntR family transcriptional regulator